MFRQRQAIDYHVVGASNSNTIITESALSRAVLRPPVMSPPHEMKNTTENINCEIW